MTVGRTGTGFAARLARPRWLALTVGALLVAAIPAAASVSPGSPGTLLGAFYGNQGWEMRVVAAMESWQGKRHAVVELFTNWNGNRKTLDNLFGQQLPNIWANGNVPLLTWEPFTGGTTPADIEVRIARGDYDAYVRTWAARLATFVNGPDRVAGTADDRRVFLRLAHEFNGNWYPWSAATGANRPADYVAMWQRVHGLVTAAGLGPSTLQWMWAPNGDDVGGFAAEEFWPGDAFVDWVAVDGYNWGATESWSTWKPAAEVLGPMVTRLRTLAPGKPLAVAEVGSTSSTVSGSDMAAKSAWVRDLYAWAPANDVRMVVYFNIDKETDWAVFGGSVGDETFRSGRTNYRAYRAYRESVAAPAYAGSDTSNPRLLTDDQFAGR